MSHDESPQPWEVLSSAHLVRDPWLTVRRERVRLPTGAVIDDYFVLEYPDWVNVLAVTPEERIVFVRQYRHGARSVNFELPAGVMEPSDESPLAAARRELLEETGYGGGEWSPLMTLSANASTHANRTHTFLAYNVTRVREPRPETTEDLRVHLIEVPEARRLVLEGEILQALNAAPLLRFLLTRESSGS